MTKIAEVIGTLQPLVTIIALCLGGVWTYLAFSWKRQRFPRAEVKHEIVQVPLSNTHVLYRVSAKVTNIGEVLLAMSSAETWIQQVLPPPAEVLEALSKNEDPVPQGHTEVQWPLLESREWSWKVGEAEIEPGESEILIADFTVPQEVQCVAAYTHVKNRIKLKQGIGWGCTTIIGPVAQNLKSELAEGSFGSGFDQDKQLPPKQRPPKKR